MAQDVGLGGVAGGKTGHLAAYNGQALPQRKVQ
jgi:hypothetical protein